jgi:hypothetical protein
VRVRLPKRIGNGVQIGIVVGLIPMICAPFLIGGAEWVYWVRFGHWPDWSLLALGWWNPAAYATGWQALDRVLDQAARSNVFMLTLLILTGLGAYGRLQDWRERRAFQEWYDRRALTSHD